MFRKKKPQPPAGSDAALVEQFRDRLNQMQVIAAALSERNIYITLATGHDRGLHAFAPEEIREFTIRRIQSEAF